MTFGNLEFYPNRLFQFLFPSSLGLDMVAKVSLSLSLSDLFLSLSPHTHTHTHVHKRTQVPIHTCVRTRTLALIQACTRTDLSNRQMVGHGLEQP